MVRPEDTALARQTYGLAMAQNNFGGPRGVWLECTMCPESHVIVGSKYGEGWAQATDAQLAEIFRHHGWTGQGDRLLKARCPTCSDRVRHAVLLAALEEDDG